MNFRRVMVVALAVLTMAAAQRSTGSAQMQVIMRSKLANTQSMLKAIVTADFVEIDRAAVALSRISEAEIVSWQNPPKPAYTEQAVIFISSIEGLRDAAKRRDLQGVGAEYANLIATCIHCHAFVRDTRLAALPDRGARPIPQAAVIPTHDVEANTSWTVF